MNATKPKARHRDPLDARFFRADILDCIECLEFTPSPPPRRLDSTFEDKYRMEGGVVIMTNKVWYSENQSPGYISLKM